MILTYEKAKILIEKAINKAVQDFKRPICVAVCDKYGFLLTFSRMDKAPIRSIRISQGKAYTSARMGLNTDIFLENLKKDNLSPSFYCDNKLTGLPGGSILKDKEGNIIGSIGISGLTAQEDQMIANAVASENL